MERGRLRARLQSDQADPLLSAAEVETVRGTCVQFLCDMGHPCSASVLPFQPYTLDIWRALSLFIGDADQGLPKTVMQGVPTGILSPIEPSGVWESVSWDADSDIHHELLVHDGPWRSASEHPDVAQNCWIRMFLQATCLSCQAGWPRLGPAGATTLRQES